MDINDSTCVLNLTEYYQQYLPGDAHIYDSIVESAGGTKVASASVGISPYNCLDYGSKFENMFNFDFIVKCDDDDCPDCEWNEKCGYIGYTTNVFHCRGTCSCLTKPFCPVSYLQVHSVYT